jgi:hypothetical protein
MAMSDVDVDKALAALALALVAEESEEERREARSADERILLGQMHNMDMEIQHVVSNVSKFVQKLEDVKGRLVSNELRAAMRRQAKKLQELRDELFKAELAMQLGSHEVKNIAKDRDGVREPVKRIRA